MSIYDVDKMKLDIKWKTMHECADLLTKLSDSNQDHTNSNNKNDINLIMENPNNEKTKLCHITSCH